MTRFLQKLFGFETRKSPTSSKRNNRVQLRLESLEDRLLQATGLVWQLDPKSITIGESQSYQHSTGHTQINVKQSHIDIKETSGSKTFTASVDFSSVPTSIEAGKNFTITATVRANGSFEIGPHSKYKSQITGKAFDVNSISNLTISTDRYAKGVDASLRTETITFTIKAPTSGTTFIMFESGMGFGRWNEPSVTSFVFRSVKTDPPPPPAGIQASFSGGVLTITGTDKADTIIVAQNNNRISVSNVSIAVNGKLEKDIAAGGVSQITIYAKAGDDKVYLNGGAQHVYAKAVIDGGIGNDLLVGAQQGSNTIYAGADNDTVWGGMKNDSLYGDYGEDSLYGLDGNDFISGGWGSDRVEGGNGDDTLYGDQHNDRLFGQAGADMLWGGEGSDWLEAGSGSEFADFGRDSSGYSNPSDQDQDINAHIWALQGATWTDIHQGQEGNCSLMAAMSSLALRGVDLSKRITYLGNFIYRVDLYTTSGRFAPQNIKFDGLRYPGDPLPTERGEYWTLLIRQAFKQMNGGNDNNLRVTDALTALTGQPTAYTAHKDSTRDGRANDALFNTIERSIRQGKNVLTGTRKDWVYDVRLQLEHAYTVVSVERDAKGMPKSVLIRNPWGRTATNSGFITVSWQNYQRDFYGTCIG